MPYKLVAVETHPIQYKAPLFRRLEKELGLDFRVVYAMIPDAATQGAGFGVPFAWDTPLLEGYRYKVLDNRAHHPSVSHFNGCDTPELFDWLKQEKPDAVLVNGWVVKTCLQALWACRRLGIPCMVRGEANLLRPRAWWKHVLHHLLLRQYSAYLAIGSANRDFYRFHKCPKKRIFHVPYVVDNERFAAESAARADKREAIRQAYDIPKDAVVFLFCGKLEPKKHPMDVIRALQRISAFSFHPSSLSPFLLVAGDGPLRAECEAFVAAHDLPVRFAGFLNQSQLPNAYAAADVLVLLSDAGETWGLVVNEAMASGRPAIVSLAAGCCRDLIIEGETGYAFDPGDIETLSRLMRRYVENPWLAAEQGVKAAKHIDKFDTQEAVKGIVEAVGKSLEKI